MEQKVKYAINLISENGQVVVSSREVAENFGKEHKHVLRDIEIYVLQIGVSFSPKQSVT